MSWTRSHSGFPLAARLDRFIEKHGPPLKPVLYWRWDILLLVGILALCWPLLFEPGVIVNCDYPVWASVVQMFDREVFPACKWAWAVPFPRVNAGEILGQAYSLSILLPWGLAQLMPLSAAIKLLVPITFLILGFGLYHFTRPMASPPACALGAYLCVLENLWYVDEGMWYNSLSVGTGLWFWIALRRYVRTDRRRWWLAAVMLLAVTIFSHPTGTIMAGVGWAGFFAYLLIHRKQYRASTILLAAIAPALACALAFPQVQALLSSNVIAPADRSISEIFPWFMAFCSRMSVLLAVGVILGASLLVRKWRMDAWMLLPAVLVAAVICTGVLAVVPSDFPGVSGLVAYAGRFRLVVVSLLTVVFAIGVSNTGQGIRLRGGLAARAVPAIATATLMLACAQAAIEGARYTLVCQTRCLVGEEGLPDRGDFTALCDWIAAHAGCDQGRMYVEDTFRNGDFEVRPACRAGRFVAEKLGLRSRHSTHYLALISLRTDAEQVNAFVTYKNRFGVEYTGDGGQLFRLEKEDWTVPLVEERTWRLNCRYLVAFSPDMCRFLGSVPFLNETARFGRFIVFTRSDMPAHCAWVEDPERRVLAHTKKSEIEYQIAWDRPQAGEAYVSLQYHPNWNASLDGRPLRIHEHKGLMQIDVPAGGTGTIVLTYRLDRAKAVGVVLLGLGLALSCVFLGRPVSWMSVFA